MFCPRCHRPLLPKAACPDCAQPGFSWARSSRKAVFIAVLVGIPLIYLGVKQVQHLRHQSGIQWDEEMSGPWVRCSSPQQSGVEIYRIHIKNQADETLTEQHRIYHPGDKMAATFHFRTQKRGRFQSRVLITGSTPIVARTPPPLTLKEGGFEQFRSSLLAWTIPSDARPGSYQVRLEVEDLDRGAKAFWETDIQILAP